MKRLLLTEITEQKSEFQKKPIPSLVQVFFKIGLQIAIFITQPSLCETTKVFL
jgi:hypothetical protein